jgi:hypothetical protein
MRPLPKEVYDAGLRGQCVKELVTAKNEERKVAARKGNGWLSLGSVIAGLSAVSILCTTVTYSGLGTSGWWIVLGIIGVVVGGVLAATFAWLGDRLVKKLIASFNYEWADSVVSFVDEFATQSAKYGAWFEAVNSKFAPANEEWAETCFNHIIRAQDALEKALARFVKDVITPEMGPDFEEKYRYIFEIRAQDIKYLDKLRKKIAL